MENELLSLVFSIEEMNIFDQMLHFLRKDYGDGEFIMAHNEKGEPRFTRREIPERQMEIIVYYTLGEVQPSRYQCYVLAVIQRNVDESE